jgi:conjugative transposon TraK protein
MITKMKTMDTAFRQMRVFVIVLVVCLTAICCYVVYSSHAQVNSHKGKIYVMINGSLVEAVARERNIPVELRDHIERFHFTFFTLSPDEKVIQRQITRALYLGDGSVKKVYQDLKESGYYNNLITSNISQAIEMDSISLDMEAAPYRFVFYGRQIITRPTSIAIRSLITEGVVRINLHQSEKNVHGFLIERWNIINNTDQQIITR